MSDEQRFANLEATVSFQDRTIQELNQAILRLQVQIDRLDARLALALERPDRPVRDLADEDPPPHY